MSCNTESVELAHCSRAITNSHVRPGNEVMTDELSKFDSSELLKEVLRRYVVELFGSRESFVVAAERINAKTRCQEPVLFADSQSEHEPPPSREQDEEQLARHSPDFRSVNWYGENYDFTAKQAACVRLLWGAWEQGTPVLSEAYIVEQVGCCELRSLFKRSPAWGTMIVPAGKGKFQLRAPAQSPSDSGE